MAYNVVLFTDIPNPDHFTRGYGAYRLASEIRKHGYTVLTVDFSSALDIETFTKIIEASVGKETLMVGFSTTWFPYRKKDINLKYIIGERSLIVDPRGDFDPDTHSWYYNSITYKIADGHLADLRPIIAKQNPKTQIVIGGAKASEYIADLGADHVMIGYSENQIIDYLNSISGKGKKRIFNKIINYDIKAEIGNFNFRSSITHYVETDCLMPEELLTFEFSRGCIFKCTFCSMAHRGQDTREYVKYKETIRQELMDNWEQWGIYKYTITDDTFNDYTEKLVLINEVVQSLPFKPVFAWAYARIDLIHKNPEQAQLLKDIGVKEVYYGLETWNDDTAKAIRKGGPKSKKIESMRIAKECWGDDLILSAGIVLGLPYDTVESANEVVEWYTTEGYKVLDNLKFVVLTIFPDDGFNQYKFLSDIEADPAHYGYSFPDPINKPYHWVRTGPGNIESRDQANQIMIESNKRCKPFYNKSRSGHWTSFKFYVDDEQDTDAYYKYVTAHYFPRLLKLLCSN